ncbi:hypothetical protein GeomeDRAFT_1427 [Geobacter metallireducens RCH3]|nr:hypothetical protein GeomeDRAFT_1427 [Geobacter metallireducens RCH3]
MVWMRFRFRFAILFLSMSFLLSRTVHGAGGPSGGAAQNMEPRLAVTPAVMDYAVNTVKPVLDASPDKDRLSQLLKVVDVLKDPKMGVDVNRIAPDAYFIYNLLDKVKLGFLYTWKFSPEQKEMLQRWHGKYMNEHPADVFFAPTADEIIKTRAGFGCTHYARAFIAVVKALGLVEKPEDLRYVVSSKADDYNRALEKQDMEKTINGHQFVLVKIDSRWIAINTSQREEAVNMPEGFSPESCSPPQNIPVRFESYPAGIIFLLRKIGKDFNDDCGDISLANLMNISRSGNTENGMFLWEPYGTVNQSFPGRRT